MGSDSTAALPLDQGPGGRSQCRAHSAHGKVRAAGADEAGVIFYFGAAAATVAALVLVWKMASQAPFSSFQTDPAL